MALQTPKLGGGKYVPLRDPKGTKTGGRFTDQIGDEELSEEKGYRDWGLMDEDEMEARFMLSAHVSDMPVNEQNAVARYTSNTLEVNATLRQLGGDPNKLEQLSEFSKEDLGELEAMGEVPQILTVSALDSAIQRNQLTEPVAVWRGVTKNMQVNILSTLKKGDKIIDHGYLSTSTDKDVSVHGFSKQNRAVMKILVDDGFDMLAPGNGSDQIGESEILFPRSSALEFVGVRKDDEYGNITVYVMRYLGANPKKIKKG